MSLVDGWQGLNCKATFPGFIPEQWLVPHPLGSAVHGLGLDILGIWGSYYNYPKPYSIYTRGTIGHRAYTYQSKQAVLNSKALWAASWGGE